MFIIFRFLYRAVTAEIEIKGQRRNNMTVVKVFKKRVDRYPNKPCFFFEDQVWTYSDVRTYASSIISIVDVNFLFVDFLNLSVFFKEHRSRGRLHFRLYVCRNLVR